MSSEPKVAVQILTPRNKFVVTFVVEEPQQLLIYNSFNGELLKIRNPLNRGGMTWLVNHVRNEGVCNDDAKVCRAVMASDEIYALLYVRENEKLPKVYEKIVNFILQ